MAREFRDSFSGAEFLIQDHGAWERFWVLHKSGVNPVPRLPEVKFPRENVIAVLLGLQSSGGGPSIRIIRIEQPDRETRIHVVEDRTVGPLDVITSPFHIVRTPGLRSSISVVHHAPR